MVSLLLLIVFLIPLIGPYQNLGYEEAKVLFFLAITTISALVWVINLNNNRQQFQWDMTKVLALGFVLSLGITSFLGVDIQGSFFGREPYFQGFVFYTYLFLLFQRNTTTVSGRG